MTILLLDQNIYHHPFPLEHFIKWLKMHVNVCWWWGKHFAYKMLLLDLPLKRNTESHWSFTVIPFMPSGGVYIEKKMEMTRSKRNSYTSYKIQDFRIEHWIICTPSDGGCWQVNIIATVLCFLICTSLTSIGSFFPPHRFSGFTVGWIKIWGVRRIRVKFLVKYYRCMP